jgi:fumarylpyruvate hydrolase
MIFKPADIVSHISHRMALEAGDLIFTGTPAGVSAVQRGDKLKAKIGRLCELTTEII